MASKEGSSTPAVSTTDWDRNCRRVFIMCLTRTRVVSEPNFLFDFENGRHYTSQSPAPVLLEHFIRSAKPFRWTIVVDRRVSDDNTECQVLFERAKQCASVPCAATVGTARRVLPLFLVPEGWLLAHVFDALPFNYE